MLAYISLVIIGAIRSKGELLGAINILRNVSMNAVLGLSIFLRGSGFFMKVKVLGAANAN